MKCTNCKKEAGPNPTMVMGGLFILCKTCVTIGEKNEAAVKQGIEVFFKNKTGPTTKQNLDILKGKL